MKNIQLELLDGTVIHNPSEGEIADALGGLDPDGDAVAILARTDMTYMQTARGDVGFALEYQVESLFQHYQCVDQELSMERVVEAFVSYSQGTGTWNRNFQWERIDLP